MNDIQLNEQDFDDKMLMCKGCEQYLLSEQIDHPQSSSNSTAMQAFMEKLTEIGTLIFQYKAILQSDLAAVEKVKQEIIDSDASSAKGFEG